MRPASTVSVERAAVGVRGDAYGLVEVAAQRGGRAHAGWAAMTSAARVEMYKAFI